MTVKPPSYCLALALGFLSTSAASQEHPAKIAHQQRSEDEVEPYVPIDTRPRRANNVVYAELLGPGIAWSVNYERTFFRDFSARAGFGVLPAQDGAPVLIPLTLAYHGAGYGAHSFELNVGIDVALLFSEGSYNGNHYNPGVDVAGLFGAGYRLQPLKGGFFLRAGVNGFISQTVYAHPYLGMGATF